MDDYIYFISTLKDFKVNEKITIDKNKNSLDVLKHYASIQTKINQKISSLLEDIVDVKKIEKENKNIFSMNEDEFLKELNSASFKKKINSILDDFEKENKKAMFYSCKVYFLEKYFFKKGISPSYHTM